MDAVKKESMRGMCQEGVGLAMIQEFARVGLYSEGMMSGVS